MPCLAKTYLVNLTHASHITRPDGTPGSTGDIVGNQAVRISGELNTRTLSIVRVTGLRILTMSLAKVTVSIKPSTTGYGHRVTATLTGTSRALVSLSIKYANGRSSHASVTLDASGHGKYTFTVPKGVNSAASQRAVVTASGKSSSATAAGFALGPFGGGSGYADDARVPRPYDGYQQLAPPPVPVRDAGDAQARMQIRIDEIETAFHLARHAVGRLLPGVLGGEGAAVGERRPGQQETVRRHRERIK